MTAWGHGRSADPFPIANPSRVAAHEEGAIKRADEGEGIIARRGTSQ